MTISGELLDPLSSQINESYEFWSGYSPSQVPFYFVSTLASAPGRAMRPCCRLWYICRRYFCVLLNALVASISRTQTSRLLFCRFGHPWFCYAFRGYGAAKPFHFSHTQLIIVGLLPLVIVFGRLFLRYRFNPLEER